MSPTHPVFLFALQLWKWDSADALQASETAALEHTGNLGLEISADGTSDFPQLMCLEQERVSGAYCLSSETELSVNIV